MPDDNASDDDISDGDDPFNVPLPADVVLPGVTFGAGTKLRLLVNAARRWKRMADSLYGLSPAQKAGWRALLQIPGQEKLTADTQFLADHTVLPEIEPTMPDQHTPEWYTGLREVEPILQFFAYQHLPAHLQAFSQPFHEVAFEMVSRLPRNPERTTMLRKLLEAKDCAVRAHLYDIDLHQ